MIADNKRNMEKRGQVEGIALGVLLLAGLIVSGALYTSEKIITEHRYVGDSSAQMYYDLKTCEIKHIDKSNLIKFGSKEEAIDSGFKSAPCIKN